MLNYCDTLTIAIMKCCCWCKRSESWFKRKKQRVEAHEEAYRRMNNEIDLLNILTLLRQSQFISLAQLKDHQKELIPCQQLYNVGLEFTKTSNDSDDDNDGPYYNLGKIDDLKGFDPKRDQQDKLLWDMISPNSNLTLNISLQLSQS